MKILSSHSTQTLSALCSRETEINLLETDLGTTIKNKVRDDNAGNYAIIGALVGSIAIAGVAYAVQSIRNKSVENEITEIEEFLNSEGGKKYMDALKEAIDNETKF